EEAKRAGRFLGQGDLEADGLGVVPGVLLDGGGPGFERLALYQLVAIVLRELDVLSFAVAFAAFEDKGRIPRAGLVPGAGGAEVVKEVGADRLELPLGFRAALVGRVEKLKDGGVVAGFLGGEVDDVFGAGVLGEERLSVLEDVELEAEAGIVFDGSMAE